MPVTIVRTVIGSTIIVAGNRLRDLTSMRSAIGSLPKVAEIVCGFSPEDQSGALDAAERRFVKAARDYGLLKSLPDFAYLRSCGCCSDK